MTVSDILGPDAILVAVLHWQHYSQLDVAAVGGVDGGDGGGDGARGESLLLPMTVLHGIPRHVHRVGRTSHTPRQIGSDNPLQGDHFRC